MKHPGQKPVIQIIVTNRCDLHHCSNCTQMLTHQRDRFFMPPELFRTAVASLVDYPGVIGVFGGNPCVHPQFDELARIMAELIPDRRRRGLWTNNLNGHGAIVREVFGYFNLNVHGNRHHAAEMQREVIEPLRGISGKDVNQPSLQVWGFDPHARHSHHAPVLVAMQDVIPDEAKRWELIGQCDVNQKWSGAITVRGDELRAYFCEIAAAFENVYGEDTGLDVTPGWWRRPMADYSDQVNRWCHSCGVPLRLRGHVDRDKTDDVSATHVSLTVGGRKHELHTSAEGDHTHEATDYQHLRSRGGGQ